MNEIGEGPPRCDCLRTSSAALKRTERNLSYSACFCDRSDDDAVVQVKLPGSEGLPPSNISSLRTGALPGRLRAALSWAQTSSAIIERTAGSVAGRRYSECAQCGGARSP